MVGHMEKVEVAPDARVLVLFVERHRRANEAPVPADEFIALDLSSGKEIARRPGIFGLFELRAIAPDGSEVLVAEPCPGFSCDNLSLWSLHDAARKAIGGRGASPGAFSPDGRRVAVQDTKASDAPSLDGAASGGGVRLTLVIIDLADNESRTFLVPEDQGPASEGFLRYAWDRDGTNLLVAIPVSEAQPQGPASVGKAAAGNPWTAPIAVLYRLEIRSGAWDRVGFLPSMFAGFGSPGEVVVWDSPKKEAFASVSVDQLKADGGTGEWWTRFAAGTRFERIVPADLTGHRSVDRLFLGEHRSYALVWRKSGAWSQVPEVWERSLPQY
jgi:hypothetical protein